MALTAPTAPVLPRLHYPPSAEMYLPMTILRLLICLFFHLLFDNIFLYWSTVLLGWGLGWICLAQLISLRYQRALLHAHIEPPAAQWSHCLSH